MCDKCGHTLSISHTSLTWKILAPYGVLHAFNRLSFPVLTNHLPEITGNKELHVKTNLIPSMWRVDVFVTVNLIETLIK